ncbi:hypothetical protein B9Z55_010575 [Caenorhabditis nigoni]|uniref:Transmembrane protein n=1 Tax=Caenorhabditis nigoni TaxID=1611254 RepID=A0A2G5UGF3_9PELO|nr:hypothetical protein B9Z55_010575 [Caenorhabditis nigoni]
MKRRCLEPKKTLFFSFQLSCRNSENPHAYVVVPGPAVSRKREEEEAADAVVVSYRSLRLSILLSLLVSYSFCLFCRFALALFFVVVVT